MNPTLLSKKDTHMDNKGLTQKANRLFDGFKDAVRGCKSLRVSALAGVAVAGPALFANTMADARVRDMAAAINGYMPPMSDRAVELNELAVMWGVGVAGAAFTAILLAKWAVSVSDKLNELEGIKTGVAPVKAGSGLRGATRKNEDVSGNSAFGLGSAEELAINKAWQQNDKGEPSLENQLLIDKGVRKLVVLAARGDEDSQFQLGRMYLEGVGVKQDFDKARSFFENAIDQGHADSAFWLSEMHLDGFGAKQCEGKGLALLKLACRGGSHAALHRFGYMCENGQGGLLEDLGCAERCYERSVELGSLVAHLDLKDLRYKMASTGVGSENKTMLEQRAGLGDSDSHYKLGVMHYSGVQVQQSKFLSQQYLFSAAAGGSAKAMNMLGQMYIEGAEMGQSTDKGLAFLQRSAELGNDSALLKLADLYEAGDLVKADPELAQAYRDKVVSTAGRVDITKKTNSSSDRAAKEPDLVSAFDSFYASSGYSAAINALVDDSHVVNQLPPKLS